MSAYKKKLLAVEKSIKILEELSDTFSLPDTSVQALNNTYELLKGMASNFDESGINGFLVPQI